jgi:hypothetical protein
MECRSQRPATLTSRIDAPAGCGKRTQKLLHGSLHQRMGLLADDALAK